MSFLRRSAGQEFPALREPEGALLFSQNITGPYLEPVEFSPHTQTQNIGPRSLLISHYPYTYVLVFQMSLFPSGFLIKILHTPVTSPIRAICHYPSNTVEGNK
jgi:hypothetical protein